MTTTPNPLDSYLAFHQALGQVSPCQWVQNDAHTFGYLSSNTLTSAYFNTLILSNNSMANDVWLDNTRSHWPQPCPQLIDVYSPNPTIDTQDMPNFHHYQLHTHYIIYHCKLASYNQTDNHTSSLTISRVDSDSSLKIWIQLQSFFHQSMALFPESYFNYFKALTESNQSIELILVYNQQIAVNASLLFQHNNMCYSGWNITPPNLQRRGYGLASLAYRIQRAKSLGTTDYVGLASPSSLSLFQTLKLTPVASILGFNHNKTNKHKE